MKTFNSVKGTNLQGNIQHERKLIYSWISSAPSKAGMNSIWGKKEGKLCKGLLDRSNTR